MKLGFIGGGVVGSALARSYMEFHEVRIHDVVTQRSTHDIHAVLECDIVFVCLPTPLKNGTHDLSYIRSFLSGLKGSTINFILKSTVPIGTTRKLSKEFDLKNLVHSPEFLTARTAYVDACTPSRNIVGGLLDRSAGWLFGNVPPVANLIKLYEERFPGVPVLRMTCEESEAVKLFQNAFFATKIAFFNEMRTLSDKLELDWHTVLPAILSDGRIAHSHTQVPGPDGENGFGGKCLPKDIQTLWTQFYEEDLEAPVIRGAIDRNEKDRHR